MKPESVKLDFQNMLSRQRYFAKASNYPKQVTNSEKGRKKPSPHGRCFHLFSCCRIYAVAKRSQICRNANRQVLLRPSAITSFLACSVT